VSCSNQAYDIYNKQENKLNKQIGDWTNKIIFTVGIQIIWHKDVMLRWKK